MLQAMTTNSTTTDAAAGGVPSATHAGNGSVVLTGYLLRSFLVLSLRAAGSALSVAELVRGLDGAGFATQGRASKDVSDALRWEVDRARVRRVARATYVLGTVPRQTAWRMRRRLEGHVKVQRSR